MMRKTFRSLFSLAAMLILGSLAYQWFNRVAVFHDEVINMAKPSLVICDYALRPLFYYLGKHCVAFLGNDLKALSGLGLLTSGLLGWLQFSHTRKLFGPTMALAVVLAYAWMGWAFALGVTGMPHALPALFATLGLHLYAMREKACDWKRITGVTFAMWAALASHPTALAFLIGFYAVLTMGMIRRRLAHKAGFAALARESAAWAAAALACLLLLEVAYRIEGNQGYLGNWAETLWKVQADETYARYHETPLYYPAKLYQRYRYLVWTAGLALLAALGRRWRLRSGRTETVRPPTAPRKADRFFVELSVFTIVSIAIVSLSSWKFERVLVSFAPFAAYALLAGIGVACARCGQWRKAVETLVLAAVLLLSGNRFLLDIRFLARQAEGPRKLVYSTPFYRLKYSAVAQVFCIGPRDDGARRLRMLATGAGKTFTLASHLPDDEASARNLIRDALADGMEWIAITVQSKPENAILRQALLAEGFALNFVYGGGAYEFWRYDPLMIGSPLETFLAHAKPIVAVFELKNPEMLAVISLRRSGVRAIAIDSRSENDAILSRMNAYAVNCALIGNIQTEDAVRLETLLTESGFTRIDSSRLFKQMDRRFTLWSKDLP